MEQIAGFPYFRLEFTKDGAVFKNEQLNDVLANVPAGTTDLIVVSHGWNNDMAEAQNLYENLFASVKNQLGQSPAAQRKLAVVGVFWPSKKFAEESQTAGGGASIGGADDKLRKRVETLESALGVDLSGAKNAISQLETNPAAQSQFIELIRAAVKKEVGTPTPDEAREDASDHFFTAAPPDILDRLRVPPGQPLTPAAPGGGAASVVGHLPPPSSGGAAGGIGSIFKSIKDRALDVANFATYFVMKQRAGLVGKAGLAPVIAKLRQKYPTVRLHLAGHSFGGRLVTAAAANAEQGSIASMALLQAAYSHSGLGTTPDGKDGFFRGVVTGKKVRGPIVITHSDKDTAVGVAYPIASRLARDNSNALGDAGDPFGGMGRNGAQRASASAQFKLESAVPHAYAFQPATIYNLNGDAVVKGHSDITSNQVACALLSAVAAT